MISPEDLDGFDSLSDAEKEVAERFFLLGYEDGYDEGTEAENNEDAWNEAFNEGFAAGEEEGYNAGIYSTVVDQKADEARQEGYQKGFEYEQQRIHSIIQMQMRWAEEQNKGRDYMFWKGVKEILTPLNLEPWSEERWQEEMEKDGF